MTLLKVDMDKTDFNKIQKIKESSGLGWREFIIMTAELYKETQASEATA